MSFGRQAPAFAANAGLETRGYGDPFLGFKDGALMKLMRQVGSSDSFIADTHHHGSAIQASVFANQLMLVKAFRVRMKAGHVGQHLIHR